MMKNKFTLTLLSFSTALLLTACGGDGNEKSISTLDNGTTNNNTTNNTSSITLSGDINVSLTIGDTYTDPNADIMIASDLNTSKEGIYTISYADTDIKRVITVSPVASMSATIPQDTNIELGGESNILYYADPRPEENGRNRALRINYGTMTFEALPVRGNNPHSIDRAGETNKFYMRTQNSYSFDVVNFDTEEVKTVELGYKPRALGGYNKKYNLQLLSAKDMPVVGVIDVSQDRVIRTLGNQVKYNPSQITSNAGSGSATGHSFWLDDDHLALIDRVNREVKIYKTTKNTDGSFNFDRTSSITTGTALHAIERVASPRTKKDLVTFYALGEGDTTIPFVPYILELTFNPSTGVLSRPDRDVYLSNSTDIVNNVKPTTHHAGISPDGKYLVAPVFDGKVYFINRETMSIEKILEAKLGAAHVEFSEQEKVAVITNHFSRDLTIIDMQTLTVKKHIRISDHGFNPNNKHLLQPHFSYLSPDGRYFYTFATQDGMFLKIDLQTLEIVDRLKTGGAPEQAHS